MIKILFIASLAGFAVAGFVWYGWELLENIGTLRKNRQEKAAAEDTEDAGDTEDGQEQDVAKEETPDEKTPEKEKAQPS